MAGSSSSSQGTPLSEASSVAELRQFIRLTCSSLVSDVVLETLTAAAVTTMVRKKAIHGFRTCCFLGKEGHGRLYDLVKQLAPTAGKKQLHANPFADFKDKDRCLQLPKDLDFLLEGYDEERVNCTLDFDLGLTDEEANQVTLALSKNNFPAWLMEPCTFLTFEENLDIRVQVVRLWISASKLPLYVGCTTTFEELRQMAVPPTEPADFALEENLPSTFQIRMRETTLIGMHWSKTMGWSLQHPAPNDLPETCPAFFKCYAKVRYPITKTEGGYPSHGRITGDCEVDKIEFEESMEDDLHDLKCRETPRMYRRLAALIYSRDV
ncbi:hypothetical protein SELMODRAFT_414289 [Selaginella moellendorffii]|uniref:Uncharacterized protein n=1 Tax=Selaginella moellendorffii TaxID=88036 RepID=D8RS97_SELML|nr:hypothetical protein SELMODRAFT_414289 [Selaginella moellendorffii]